MEKPNQPEDTGLVLPQKPEAPEHEGEAWLKEVLEELPELRIKMNYFLKLAEGVDKAEPGNLKDALLSSLKKQIKAWNQDQEVGDSIGTAMASRKTAIGNLVVLLNKDGESKKVTFRLDYKQPG